MLTQVVRWEWLWLNPAALASPPRVEPAEIRPPSVEQIGRLLDTALAGDVDFYTCLHLAVMTCARCPWRPNWVTRRSSERHREVRRSSRGERYGLTVFRLHDLRHSRATAMLAAGDRCR